MSAVVISNRWPAPLHTFRHGTAQRMRLMMRATQQAVGGPLHLLLVAPYGTEWSVSHADALREDFAQLWGVQVGAIVVEVDPQRPVAGLDSLWHGYLRPATSIYRQYGYARVVTPALQSGLARLLAETRPAVVLAHRLQAMALLRRSGLATPPVVFDMDDIESKAFVRNIAQPPLWRLKPLLRLQVPALRRTEAWAIRRAVRSFVCSDADAADLNRHHSTQSVLCAPNAVSAPRPSPLPQAPVVLMLGTYGYEPNRIGAEWLIASVWPEVMRRHGQARLVIAGNACDSIAQYSDQPPGVEFAGFVDDLDALYARTRIVVCPIHSGGGTRIKIIEGALQGRPVVSTTLGAEGLVFRADANEIVIADTPKDFASAVCHLLDHVEACERIGRTARLTALRHYDETEITSRVADAIRDGCALSQ